MTALITFSGQPAVAESPRPDGAAASTRRWRATRCSVWRICPHDAPNEVSHKNADGEHGGAERPGDGAEGGDPGDDGDDHDDGDDGRASELPTQLTIPTGSHRVAGRRDRSCQWPVRTAIQTRA